ncbi:MAG TPA: hypothetical protein VN605_09805, partial [Thermoanaerobaculia bacterium]|nr:hypothetical protein [Thermoanaerobaculia bacterium]
GVWRKTTDRWSNSLTAGYDSGGDMTTVTDTDGRVWTLAYDSNHLLTSITDRDGNQWRFAYDGSNRLEKVFDPLHTGTTPWRQFTWVTYNVSKPAVLALVTDESGAVLEGHQYDSNGRATSSWSGDTSGSPPAPGTNARDLVTLSYDSSTQTTVSTKIDTSLTQSTVYTLTTGAGRFLATSIVGSCGTCGTSEDAVSYSYDSDNRALTKTVGLDKTSTGGTDERVTSTYTYNSDGLVLTAVQATGKSEEHTITYAYGYASWPEFATAVTEASVAKSGQNRSTTYAWNTSGTPETTLTTTRSGYQLSTDSSATTYTTTTLFDSRHRLTEIDGPVTNQKTTRTYYGDTDSDLNRRGRLQQVLRYSTTSASLATTFDDYNVFGMARKETDANAVDVTLTTDGRGRILTRTSVKPSSDSAEPANYVSTYAYDGRDRLTSITHPRANSIRYKYEDGTNRLLETIRVDSSSLEHERLLLTLNTVGLRTAEAAQDCATPANPCSAWTTRRSDAFAYDVSSRLTTITHPDSTTLTYAYDSRGNQTAVKDERHSSANALFSFDFRNRLKQATQKRTIVSGSDVVTQYGYNDHDDLTSVIDPNGNTTTYSFDDFGRMQKQISPVTGTTTYAYDAAGNLTSTTDANAATTARTYDLLDRATGSTSTRSGSTTETLGWTYDDATAGYYGKGRVATMTDPTGSTSFRYERRGSARYEAKTIGGTTYSTSCAFDANGNRSSITYPSSRVVNYTFDFADRPASAATSSTTYVSSATYQPFGPQSQEVFGNSTTRTTTYDSRYRPSENKLMAGASARADYNYVVDGVGNITEIHDALDSTYNRDFAYDDLNRLVGANGGTSLWGTGSYSYDAMGNMTALTLGTTHTATFSYSETTPKLTSVTENGSTGSVTYDSAGNETVAAAATSTISARNQVGRTDHTAYLYDARGVRATASFDALQLSLSPSSVIGRVPSHATVTLTLPAPTGGTVVTLSSSDTAKATVPSSVTVTATATQATFDITTFDVSSTSTVTITASISGGASTTAVLTLTVPSYHLSSIVIDPNQVDEDGDTTTGTVTLAAAAPTGGAIVFLHDDYDLERGKKCVGPSVTVASGQTTATFTVTGHRFCEFGPCSVLIHVTGTLGNSVTTYFSCGPDVILEGLRKNRTIGWLERLFHRRGVSAPPIALAFANGRLA